MRTHSLLFTAILALSACAATTPPATQSQKSEQQPASDPLSLVPETGPANCVLCVKTNPLFVVDKDGSASGDLNVCNTGQMPLELAPGLTDFRMARPSATAAPLNTVRAITGVDGKPIPEGTMVAANKCTGVRLQVTKFGQGGFATAEFTNAGNKLIEVKAVRYDLPFNLKLEGPTPEKLDTTFTRGVPGKIRLRNEDGIGYRFHWRLELGDDSREGYAVADPRGRIEIEVRIDDGKFTFLESGFLRSGTIAGQLILDYDPDASFRGFPRPQKVYPVAARLNYFKDTAQRFWTSFFALAVLLLGILLSLLINFVLPMQSERVGVRQSLSDLNGKLAGLGETVDSRLLSLLRVEKKRLGQELRVLLPLFPQTQIELPKLRAKVELIGRRINLTVQAGALLDTLRTDGELLSAHEADEIRVLCQDVHSTAGKSQPTEEDLKAAQLALDKATKILEQADGNPTPERLERLRTTQKNVEDEMDKYKNGIASWQMPEWQQAPLFEGAKLTDELLQGCQKNFPPPAPAEPDRLNYNRQAKAVRTAELMVEYARLVETAADAQIRSARLKRLPDLFAALKPGPGESIRRAAEIVKQIEQNISPAEIEQAIRDATQDLDMWIEKDPVTPFPLQLITFRVRFKKPGLDAAVARKEIWCKWRIAGEEQETLAGWLAGFFFELRPRWLRRQIRSLRRRLQKGNPSVPQYPFLVEATFPNLGGKTFKAEVRVERARSYVESRTVLALASLIVTVLIVGFGLLATAQEKLQSVDWISGFLAILVLGYTANAVKNMITKS